MAWRVMVADTTTGAVVSELPWTQLRWSDSLDVTKGSSLMVTVPLESPTLDQVRSVARGPWRHTLLAAWDDVAVVAGPLVTHRVEPDQTAVELGCTSPGALLAARMVIRPDFELTPDLAGANVGIGPASLPYLALRMIEQAASVDGSATAGVLLPLIPPDLPATGEHTRRFESTDLATWMERLGELSRVENGPEIHLQPVLYADEQLMAWLVRIGTPYLGSATPWTWTLGGNCISIGVDSDGSEMAHRVYTAGRTETLVSASGAAPAVQITTVGVAQDLTLLGIGWPLLERADRTTGTGQDDNAPKRDELTAQARERLRVASRPVEAWGVAVRGDHHPRLGTYSLGDTARLVHHGHRWLGDGTATRRILGHSGDGGDVVTLDLADAAGVI